MFIRTKDNEILRLESFNGVKILEEKIYDPDTEKYTHSEYYLALVEKLPVIGDKYFGNH